MKRLLITDEDIKEYANRNKEKWIREKKERDAKLKSIFSSYDLIPKAFLVKIICISLKKFLKKI